jgi:Raf kinase inhibitor-like YbhB/YbcL family protein
MNVGITFARVITLAAGAWLAGCATMDQTPPGAFRIGSPALADNAMLSVRNAGNNKGNPNCTGENVSPALAWSNPPPKTRSYAIIMHDQAGRDGLGVLHWLAYGIPADLPGLAEGEASTASAKFVGGKNIYGAPTYAGPCPPRGGAPQHYAFTLIATDLDPGALAAGLTQQELLDALKGHNLKAANFVLRFGQ